MTSAVEKRGFFYQHRACADARVRGVKNNGTKIRRCSRMGNFCPHAAALPKSVQEYEYIVYSCTIGDDGGRGLLAFLADRCSSGAPPGICLSFETGGKRAQNRKK